jgi:hypothetical protein
MEDAWFATSLFDRDNYYLGFSGIARRLEASDIEPCFFFDSDE